MQNTPIPDVLTSPDTHYSSLLQHMQDPAAFMQGQFNEMLGAHAELLKQMEEMRAVLARATSDPNAIIGLEE